MPCIKQKEKLMEKIIEVKNLFYEYPRTNENENTIALQGVDFSIERGEFVGIIGHNGSGKSTLSKLLNAIMQPTDGNSTYRNRIIDAIFHMDGATLDKGAKYEVR